MYCASCGKAIDETNKFCPYCGAKIENKNDTEGKNNQLKVTNQQEANGQYGIDNSSYSILKEYLKGVYQLEKSIFSQNNLIQNIKKEIKKNENWVPDAPYERITLSDTFYEIFEGNTIGCFAGSLILGFAIGAIVAAFKYGDQHFVPQFIGMGIGCLIFVLISIVIIIAVMYDNFWIRKENRYQKKEAKQYRVVLKRKNELLKNELTVLDRSTKDTQDVLDQYYNQNIIYPNYRGLIPISSIYGYFESERCYTLKGPYGAYNKYDNELFQKTILNKIDEVIEHLDRIESNQYMLYDAIKESNQIARDICDEISVTAEKMQNIENHQRTIAYNSQITAENMERIRWLETTEFLQSL